MYVNGISAVLVVDPKKEKRKKERKRIKQNNDVLNSLLKCYSNGIINELHTLVTSQSAFKH